MNEILRNLRAGALVLDLGSGSGGSVAREAYPDVRIIRLDNERPKGVDDFVVADGARLPFADHAFDAVIANHSLEHIAGLDAVLAEIGRVVRAGGSLYVAVPDASTLSDHIYQWMFHGGGHINPFRSADALEKQIASATGLRPAGRRVLCTSLVFLERHRFGPRPPRRLWLFANGHSRFLAWFAYVLRRIDFMFGTRLSVYGWAFYFGNVLEEIDTVPWTNVCVRCGAGQSSASLLANGEVSRRLVSSYHCSSCGEWNLFTDDRLRFR
ncbi:MAG TPA: methyltransferase domain-containing protein [Bryobacteraceae bacterium]